MYASIDNCNCMSMSASAVQACAQSMRALGRRGSMLELLLGLRYIMGTAASVAVSMRRSKSRAVMGTHLCPGFSAVVNTV
jgi:hypothetical protein